MVRVKVSQDFKTLPAQTPTNPVKPYEEIAEGMEANFSAHMLAEMRKTIPKESPDSSAMEYYNSLLDYERAQLMAKSDSGLGIKKRASHGTTSRIDESIHEGEYK
jgi:Rod binding domain-containing protein